MLAHLENEAALVAEARNGDNDAFATLVRQYDRHLYRLVLNITSNPEDAKDALQECLLKAYTHLSRFECKSRFYTWLARIAVNEALMKLRKNRGEKEVSLDDDLETDDGGAMPREIEDWSENPEEHYSRAELKEILTAAIENLRPPYRLVFLLRDVDRLSIEETAQTLGLSVPAAKSRLLRARLELREALNPYFHKSADHGLQRSHLRAL